jgi:hypothetical protein
MNTSMLNETTTNQQYDCTRLPTADQWSDGRPDDWSDDTRMNFLFSIFRSHELNPASHDSKMKFWRDTITVYCTRNHVLQFELDAMKEAMKRKGVSPQCLQPVLSKHFSTRADLLRTSSFLNTSLDLLTWSTGQLMRPLFYLSSSLSSSSNNASTSLIMTRSVKSVTNSSTSSPSKLQQPDDSKIYVLAHLVDEKARQLVRLVNERLVVYRNVNSVVEYADLLPLLSKPKKDSDKMELDEKEDKEVLQGEF